MFPSKAYHPLKRYLPALLVAVLAAAANAAACTSWVIHRDVVRSGRMIVHKVLDQYRRDGRLTAEMRVAHPMVSFNRRIISPPGSGSSW